MPQRVIIFQLTWTNKRCIYVELKNLPDAHWMWMWYHTAAALLLSACNFTFYQTQWHSTIDTMCTSSMCDTHPKLHSVSHWIRISATSNKWAMKRKKFIFRAEEVEKVTMTNFCDYMLICLFSNGLDLGVKCICRHSVIEKCIERKMKTYLFFCLLFAMEMKLFVFVTAIQYCLVIRLICHSVRVCQQRQRILVLNGERQFLWVSLEFASNESVCIDMLSLLKWWKHTHLGHISQRGVCLPFIFIKQKKNENLVGCAVNRHFK